jgi:hypothetical protein
MVRLASRGGDPGAMVWRRPLVISTIEFNSLVYGHGPSFDSAAVLQRNFLVAVGPAVRANEG